MRLPTENCPSPRSALAIGAHPDDIEFGAGGTLAKWAANGCEVFLLVLTDGSKGSWDQSTDQRELIAVRESEQRDAATALGARAPYFLHAVDGELTPTRERIRDVCAMIRELQPEVVLAHDPWKRYRIHPDHRAAGWIALDAVVAARDHLFFEELGTPPHRPARVLLFEADEVHHLEDVSASVDTKIEALLCHRSQWKSTMGIDPSGDVSVEHALFASRIRVGLTRDDGRCCEAFAEMTDI